MQADYRLGQRVAEAIRRGDPVDTVTIPIPASLDEQMGIIHRTFLWCQAAWHQDGFAHVDLGHRRRRVRIERQS